MKKNILILGAFGGVGQAFLLRVKPYRRWFHGVILIDRKNGDMPFPATIIPGWINITARKKEYLLLLRKYAIDIVVDLTYVDTIPILMATNTAGVSYVNTALCDHKKISSDLVFYLYPKRKSIYRASHILCSGMNPGVVNMLVQQGIEKYGVPESIIHFEYDTSYLPRARKPMITWSPHEFLAEAIQDPGGIVLGRNKVQLLYPNALENRVSLCEVLQPICSLSQYPEAMPVLHDENLTLAQKYNIPSQFLYAIHPKTMKTLLTVYKKKKKPTPDDFVLGDNITHRLRGTDMIGVLLIYRDKKVYYLNTVVNKNIQGTNATYFQVSIGVTAALHALLFDKIKKGVHFVEDLQAPHYRKYVFEHLDIKEYWVS